MTQGRSMDVDFEIIRHLEVCTREGGGPFFRSLGDDPGFEVHFDRLGPSLRAGWWRLQIGMRVLDGIVMNPRLYANHGDGYNETDCVVLPEPDAAGNIDSVLYFRDDVQALRFDPTVRTADFTIDSAQLRPMGRARTAWQLLSSSPAGGGSVRWRQMGARLGHVLRLLPTSGFDAALRDLAAHGLRDATFAQWSYDTWYRLYEPLDTEIAARVPPRDLIPGLDLTVVVHVADPLLHRLQACVQSVLEQSWPHWRMVIVVHGATGLGVQALLEELAQDSRIAVHHDGPPALFESGNMSGQPGDESSYIASLGQHDQLCRWALAEVIHALAANPRARLIYSDEDCIDDRGHRQAHHMKPDWNPDLWLAHDYIGALRVLRCDLARALDTAGARSGTPGESDLWAMTGNRPFDTQDVLHVPKVLYHRWQEGDQPAAAPPIISADLAIASRVGNPAFEILDDGQRRVRWSLPDPPPLVSIIIPTRDRADLLGRCIASIFERTDYPAFEIIIVDNGSREPEAIAYLDSLARRAGVRVVRVDAPFNFSALVNHGARHARGDILCLLNNDMQVISRDWLVELASQAARPAVGAVGAMLYYPDDTIQHGGLVLGIGSVAGHIYHRCPRGSQGYHGRARVAQQLSAVTAACLAVRASVFREVDGFDESFPIAFNDIDFCLRLLEQGYRNVWTPFAELYHWESASRGSEDTQEKRARFDTEATRMQQRWSHLLAADPAYNPNLSLHGSQFELSFPPRTPLLETYQPAERGFGGLEAVE